MGSGEWGVGSGEWGVGKTIFVIGGEFFWNTEHICSVLLASAFKVIGTTITCN
ncbi:MAG: hypothetical protein DSM106950_34475 [Stigonema ocellatum SAG 48.90 = DSM 106950]|nr:hypothetical protein [Stigonema ocellatum SAG 48.90 = DSM 106950]